MRRLTAKFQDAKIRVIALLVVVVVLLVSGIFAWRYYAAYRAFNSAAVSLTSAPDITSIPGAGNPSTHYVQEQTAQNIQEEQAARQAGTSAVPTITRPSFIGPVQAFGTAASEDDTQTGRKVCKIKKVVVLFRPNPASCTLQNLRIARETGVTAEELLCQGCNCPSLKAAGYTAGDLKSIGETAKQLQECGFTLAQLVQAGFTPSELKDAGFSAKQLADAGFSPSQLAAAGYTPDQIQNAGYSNQQLRDAGLKETKCDVSALEKARAEGVSATTLREEGCGLTALKAAGYTAGQLKNAGFNADQLKAAGFNDAQLGAAGFTPAEIAAANRTATVCSVEQLEKDRAAGVSALELKNRGCNVAALKAAGYTAAELKAAGFTAKQLKDAGFTAAQLRGAGYTAQQLKNAGFSAAQLKNAGYTAAQLKDAGFTAAQLKNAGFSTNQLKDAGYTAAQLKAAGYSPGELLAAGYTPEQLKDAGFTASQLRGAGLTAAQLKDAGFTPSQLNNAGYTKGDLLRAGFSPEQAGYASPVVQAPVQPVSVGVPQISAPPASAALPSIRDDSPEAKLARFERMQQEQLDAQQRQDQIQQQQAAMTLEAQKLLAAWSNNPLQIRVETTVRPVTVDVTGAATTTVAGAAGEAVPGETFKAGKVFLGALESSIDSDEQSPVLAKILSGPLAGSKLLGRFTRGGTRLVLRFNILSAPHLNASIPVNIVAIDPDTAHTAISGAVNNHYLLRYGTLFASSFLSGISQGILSSNTSQSCFFGFCTTQRGALSTAELVGVGFGRVGDRYASVLGQNFNRPPTVKIQGGTGIGLLVMSDFTIPKAPEKPGVNFARDAVNDSSEQNITTIRSE